MLEHFLLTSVVLPKIYKLWGVLKIFPEVAHLTYVGNRKLSDFGMSTGSAWSRSCSGVPASHWRRLGGHYPKWTRDVTRLPSRSWDSDVEMCYAAMITNTAYGTYWTVLLIYCSMHGFHCSLAQWYIKWCFCCQLLGY